MKPFRWNKEVLYEKDILHVWDIVGLTSESRVQRLHGGQPTCQSRYGRFRIHSHSTRCRHREARCSDNLDEERRWNTNRYLRVLCRLREGMESWASDIQCRRRCV